MEGLDFGFAVRMTDHVSKSADTATAALLRLYEAVRRLKGMGGSIGSLRKGVDRASTSASNASSNFKKVEKSAKRATSSIKGLSITSLGTAVAFRTLARASALLAGAAGLKSLIAIGADFEQGMRNVQSVTGISDERLKVLGKDARKVAVDLGASGKDTTTVMYALGSAGLSASESIKALPDVFRLATATQSDFGLTAELVTSTMKTYNLRADQMTEATDAYAKVIASSPANLRRMSDAMKYFSPIAASLGKTVFESALEIGALHQAGIKGEQAGTSLRNIYARLIKPSENLTETLRALGLSTLDLHPKFNTLEQILDKMAPLADDVKGRLLKLLGVRGAPAFMQLLNRGSAGIRELRAAMEEASGTQDMFETQMKSFTGATKYAKAALEEVARVIWDLFQDDMSKGMRGFYDWLVVVGKKLELWGPLIKQSFELVGNVLNVAWKIFKGFAMGVMDAIGLTKYIAAASKKSLMDVMGPLQVLLHVILMDVRDFGSGLFEGVRDSVGMAFKIVYEFGKAVFDAVTWFTDLVGITNSGTMTMKDWGRILGNIIGSILAFKALRWVFMIPVKWITGWWTKGKKAWRGLIKLGGIARLVFGRLQGVFMVLKWTVSAIATAIGATTAAVLGLMAAAFALGLAIGALIWYWDDVEDAIVDWGGVVNDTLSLVGGAIADFAVDTYSDWSNWISKLNISWSGFTGWLKDTFPEVAKHFENGLLSGMKSIWDLGINTFKEGWGKFEKFLESSYLYIEDVFDGGLIAGLVRIWDGFWDYLTQGVDKLKMFFKDPVTAIKRWVAGESLIDPDQLKESNMKSERYSAANILARSKAREAKRIALESAMEKQERRREENERKAQELSDPALQARKKAEKLAREQYVKSTTALGGESAKDLRERVAMREMDVQKMTEKFQALTKEDPTLDASSAWEKLKAKEKSLEELQKRADDATVKEEQAVISYMKKWEEAEKKKQKKREGSSISAGKAKGTIKGSGKGNKLDRMKPKKLKDTAGLAKGSGGGKVRTPGAASSFIMVNGDENPLDQYLAKAPEESVEEVKAQIQGDKKGKTVDFTQATREIEREKAAASVTTKDAKSGNIYNFTFNENSIVIEGSNITDKESFARELFPVLQRVADEQGRGIV